MQSILGYPEILSQVVSRLTGDTHDGLCPAQTPCDEPLEHASGDADLGSPEMSHPTADGKDVMAGDDMGRVRECGHIHRIRVIAQMNNLCASGGAPQFAPEKDELVCIA